MDSKITLNQQNPHDRANILSKLLLTWSFSLFKRGYKHGITINDLWMARQGDLSGRLGDRLEEAWHEEVAKAKETGHKPSFSRALVKSFWVEYMMCGLVVGLLYIILWPLIPYTLALFIEYFGTERTDESYRNAHIYNALMNIFSICTSLLYNHTQLSQAGVGMKLRIACCSLLYRKILKLDKTGMSRTETGQVINLMSNDVNRFDMVALFLNYIWVMPVVVPVVSFLVWQHVAWATISALVVVFLQTVIVQAYLSNLQGKLRGKIAKRTDERVKVMSELVSGVQVIKMYAWEIPFTKIVDKLRKWEVSFILRTSMIKGFSTALGVFTERFILFSAITTYVLLGGQIRSEITFSLVQYFNLLQLSCNIFFPLALSFLAETKVSISRIEEFLQLEELKEPTSGELNMIRDSNLVLNGGAPEKLPERKPSDLVLNAVHASWHSDPIVPTLRNITFTAKVGEFIGIAGLVGSGKSSLLNVILGELPPMQGKVSFGGSRISYASQEPWLFVATVRQNILFGLPYDRIRYKKVVTACALVRDFEQLPAGDSTLVGERGISLSGGQRARIGLARACYRQADIYLLDDPLSAVDTHVGKHLISECVNGLLRHSTRILVTHQLHHLKTVDNLIILRNGEIETQGKFDEVSNSPLFAELLEEEDEVKAESNLPRKLSTVRQRTMSTQSHASSVSTVVGQDADALDDEQQETEEVSGTGRVPASVYSQYFRSGGNWFLLTVTVLFILVAQVVTSASDMWLTEWMNQVEKNRFPSDNLTALQLVNGSSDSNDTVSEMTTLTSLINDTIDTTLAAELANLNATTTEEHLVDHTFYIYVWAILIFACIVLTTTRAMMFLWVCMRSSIKLHNQMFTNIMSATMRFFDTNPSGRILNRFSKDMGIVDEILPKMYLDAIQVFMVMMGILVMVVIVDPYQLLNTGFCAILMIIWTMIYLNTAQAIKRVEGVSRSPVFSHVSATMSGLTTVRSCGAQPLLKVQFDDKQDVHTAAWYLTLVTNTAFSIWLNMVSSLYVLIVSYTFLLLDNGDTKAGNVGLAISQSLILVNMVQYGVKQATEVVSQMTSVERVTQFTSLPQEEQGGPPPPASWPTKARLVFKNLYLRYDKDSDPVLKDLNITIESGWKVGVVGRTGAGKSSLISALFRLAPIEGDVLIDNIDTGKIGLKELRSKIAIIPQEPVLFSASLRYNLDPFDRYSDADIWKALEQVELKNLVTSLSSNVSSGGSNFSAGQRQLLCLARAALARNKLLVLDEATANVDPNTDAFIQRSLRKDFVDCTVITVAHRLHTVADSDRVVVMEAGRIVEVGHPHQLLADDDGYFSRMVKQLGPAAEQSLRELARSAHARHIHYADADETTAI